MPAEHAGREESLHHAFTLQAARTPGAVAIDEAGRTLTYEELDQRSGRMARQLAGLRTGGEFIVAVYLNRSIASVAAMLGILKAGAAFMPLDPSYPPDRLAYMLEDSGACAVISDADLAARLPGTGAILVLVDQEDAEGAHDVDGTPAADPAPRRAAQLAYVIYTSGSTGKPKGVMCTHAGILNRLLWMRDTFEVSASDRILQKTPTSFDVSVWETFLPLISGACIVLARQDGHLDLDYLARLIAQARVTISHFLPSALQIFLDQEKVRGFTALRHAFCGGETLFYRTVTDFRAQSGARMHNVYGPTEASIGVTCWHAGPREDGLVPIGKPIRNVRIHVLDSQFQPVTGAATGEIFIAGVQLARGYLDRPAWTAEKFVPDPFAHGERMYRTGDLGRWLPDGQLEFLGRGDHQVKLHGYRIEMGEIEAALMAHEDVTQAAVIVLKSDDGERLASFVASERKDAALPVQLRKLLRARLPHYMVPAQIVAVTALPTEPNGKVSRQSLAALVPPAPQEDSLAPRNEVERRLEEIWKAALHAKKIGMQKDFFAAGGHSLAAASVVERINRAFSMNFPVRIIFEKSTIEELAAEIAAGHASRVYSPLVTLRKGHGALPFFCVHAVGGTAFRYKALADRLPADIPVFGLQASGLEDGEPLAASVQAMALQYRDAIRAVQPRGPYRLLGWSFGGLVAYELAHQLTRDNETVSLLALLDTPVPLDDESPDSLNDTHVARALANQLMGPGPDGWHAIATLEDLMALAHREKSVPAEFTIQMARRLAALVKNSIAIGRRYRPARLAGSMLYVRATRAMPGRFAPEASYDWARFTRTRPETVELACTHLDLGQPFMADALSQVIAPRLRPDRTPLD